MSFPPWVRTRSQHVALLRAERHADAEFARALDDVVSHHAVNTDGGNDERDPGKHCQQQHRETLARDALGHDFLQRPNRADRLILVDRIDRGTQRAEQAPPANRSCAGRR